MPWQKRARASATFSGHSTNGSATLSTLIMLHMPGAISLWVTSVSATQRDLSP